MSFSDTDYEAAAARLGVPVAAIKAVAEVEAGGATHWNIAGALRPPVRLEAHWFGKLTGYQFNASHPEISCTRWTPGLAARTWAGAWAQVEAACALDENAARQATSWGAFQIMGFHWKALGYASVQEMVAAMDTTGGQLDAFVRFVEADPVLLDALRRQDWHAFAGRYNGPGQVDHYAGRIAQACARHGGE